MSLALCLAVLLSCSHGVGAIDSGRPRDSSTPAPLRPIPVAVLAPADVTPSLLTRIWAEADAIFAPAGIIFLWHRVAPNEAAPSGQLDVTIEDRRRDAPQGETALGWITFTGDEPEPSIHLSRVSAEDLLELRSESTDTRLATHEMMLGRALGRALSHELGHYLLKSKGHTTDGLMRAVWPTGDFFATGGRFKLSRGERQVVAWCAPEATFTKGLPAGE
jgi:hypothetical protein